jgi:hypothetical protein
MLDCTLYGDGLDGRGSNVELPIVSTDCGAHPAFCSLGTGGFLPWGRSGRGEKLTTHLHVVPRSRMVELYHHSPICLHGLVLNYSPGKHYLVGSLGLVLVSCRFRVCCSVGASGP